jgi:hypothetical protein
VPTINVKRNRFLSRAVCINLRREPKLASQANVKRNRFLPPNPLFITLLIYQSQVTITACLCRRPTSDRDASGTDPRAMSPDPLGMTGSLGRGPWKIPKHRLPLTSTEAPTETPVAQIRGPSDLIHWVQLGALEGSLRNDRSTACLWRRPRLRPPVAQIRWPCDPIHQVRLGAVEGSLRDDRSTACF